jgi:hypothetical protein
MSPMKISQLWNEEEGKWVFPWDEEWKDANEFPFTDSELLSDSEQALEEMLEKAYPADPDLTFN